MFTPIQIVDKVYLIMINEYNAKKFCCEDISLIENYEKAINDKSQSWHCHHRAEILPCGKYLAIDLMNFKLYWHRPASELIFLSPSEHHRIHSTGFKFSKESRLKKSKNMMGNKNHFYGKKHTKESRLKNSIAIKSMKWWNNGVICKRSRECPGIEWKRGRLKKKSSE